jgi:RNA polymerase sigma-70 factor (ECF subfamily)
MNLTERSDESLLRAFAVERDHAALDALIARHWERAFRLALRVLGDPHAAEDVAQETFVKVARGAARFERDRAFAPWLYAIALNTARSAVRALKRRRLHEAAAGVALAERRAGDAAPGSSIDSHLETLPDELRVPLLLRYGEELSLEEVAAALGCPVGTASSRLRRGLEKLREVGVGTSALALFLRSPVTASAPPSAGSIASRVARGWTSTLATFAVAILAGIGLAIAVFLPPAAPARAAAPATPAVVAPLEKADAAAVPSAASSEDTAPAPLEPVAAVPVDEAPAKAPAAPAARPEASERLLAGRVVADEDGTPVEDARIVAVEEHEAERHGGVVLWGDKVAVVRSAPDGRFSVPLQEHPYPIKLVVTAPGRAPLVRVVASDPGDLRLPASGLRLEGDVVAKATGQPVPGVTVHVSQDGAEASAVSDAAGRFVFPGLAPGRATLKVGAADGFVPLERPVRVEPGANVRLEVEASATLVVRGVDGGGDPVAIGVDVSVDGGGSQFSSATREQVFPGLAPGARIHVSVERERSAAMTSGIADALFEVTLAPGERRVLTATIDPAKDATIDVFASDARGAALVGAKLNVRRAPSEGKLEFTGLGLDATTGKDGHRSFTLPPGRYDLRLDGQPACPTVVVAASERKSVVAKRKGDRKLEGTVVTADGKAVERAQVTFYADLGGDEDEGPSQEVTAESDAGGHFTLEGIPDLLAPRATLMVWKMGFEASETELATLARLDGLEIKLEAEPPKAEIKVTIELPAGKTLPDRSQVFFASDRYGCGAALENDVATLAIPRGFTGRLIVVAPGCATLSGPVVEAGKDAAVRIAFSPVKGRTISGRIVDAAGKAVAGGHAGILGIMKWSDGAADGSFTIEDAPLEAFELDVGGRRFEQKHVPVGAGEVAPLVIALEPRRR